MAKKIPLSSDMDAVYNVIEDYIFEKHKLCSVAEIQELTNFNKSKCNSILEALIKKKKIYKIFESKGNATVYILSYMMDEILRTQKKPRWIEKYSFKEKDDKIKKINSLKKEINLFEQFERLIYATDTPLEEAVFFAFQFLGFKDVVLLNDNNLHDVEFNHEEILYLAEVKGKSKSGNKDDIQELEGWIKKKIVTENMKRNELEGLFVINHFRNVDIDERDGPLTPHAKEFLKLNNFKFIATYYLFDIVKKVCNSKISEENARNLVISGQEID